MNAVKYVPVLIGIVMLGSVWGFFEATLGAFLHLVNSPNKGEIMTSFGIMVMSASAAIYRPKNTISFMLGVGVVASLVKGVDLLFLPLDSHVLRVMVVIPLEALSFGITASFLYRILRSKRILHASVGALSAYGSFLLLATVYIYGGVGSSFWVGKGLSDAILFTVSNGTIAAVLGAITADLGFRAGETLRLKVAEYTSRSPLLYYLASLALSGILWAARTRVA